MKKWKEYYNKDISRFGISKPDRIVKTFLKLFRKNQFSPSLISRIRFRKIKQKLNIELFAGTNIGYGLYLGHPFGITINAGTIIGNNCNIHKGVTIGQENRGQRKGAPSIGNKVWIGVNSTIVGAIKVGDNVLIAPNTFINCDIPSNSVVFGNPCVIKERKNATSCYINNIVE